jgi:hypothetical protein
MTATKFNESAILEALERAIRPLDESASSLTLNERLLDLIIDELLTADDPARAYALEPWLVLLDVCTPSAYELAMTVDDKDQAGHSWHGLCEQTSARYDAELVSA